MFHNPKSRGRQMRGSRNQRKGKGKGNKTRNNQTTTQSITQITKKMKGRPCIILLGGSFNPPHKAHFELLKLAKQHLENQGLIVRKCHMVVSTDKYLIKKMSNKRGNGTGASNGANDDIIFSEENRIAMCCSGAVEYGNWLHVSEKPYISVVKFLKKKYKYSQDRIVFIIRGEDKWNSKYIGKKNTGNMRSLYVKRDGSSEGSNSIEFLHDKPLAPGLSSTLIRQLIKESENLEKTIDELVSTGKLNPSVGKYLLENIC